MSLSYYIYCKERYQIQDLIEFSKESLDSMSIPNVKVIDQRIQSDAFIIRVANQDSYYGVRSDLYGIKFNTNISIQVRRSFKGWERCLEVYIRHVLERLIGDMVVECNGEPAFLVRLKERIFFDSHASILDQESFGVSGMVMMDRENALGQLIAIIDQACEEGSQETSIMSAIQLIKVHPYIRPNLFEIVEKTVEVSKKGLLENLLDQTSERMA